MRSLFRPLLALLLVLGVASWEDDEEDTYAEGEEGDHGDGAGGDDDEAPPQAVYVMEHGFLSGAATQWTPRGALSLSGAPGRGFEARLSDAKEFVQMRPELQPLMSKAADSNHYYAIRMYSPEKPKRILQASIPAKLLADHFEDWHDILEVTVGSTGAPVSLSYRVRNTLGLALFDHTQVHIAEPSRSKGPRINTAARAKGGAAGAAGGGGKGGEEQASPQSFLRKYWWVIIIVLLLLTMSGDDGGGKASGGGGRK